MTPFVKLQEVVLRTLRKISEENPEDIRLLARKYCVANPPQLLQADIDNLRKWGLSCPDEQGEKWYEEYLLEILREQIDNTSGQEIVIRNLLGRELYGKHPIGYEEFILNRGSGNNQLRTYYFSHPEVLKKGDVLANGDRLLSPPREGGNGSVLLHLTGGVYGHWIGVPARIPIALLITELGAPSELVEK